MKIAGRTPSLPRREFALLRDDGDFVLRLAALPLGVEEVFRAECPEPQPPLDGFARDPKSKAVLLDEGGRPIARYNLHDAVYIAARRAWNRRWSVFMVAQGLRDDPGVRFDADPKQPLAAHLDAIYEELAAAGITPGELAQLLDAVMLLSGLGDDAMERARADFSARAASAPAGACPTTQAEPSATGAGESGKG